MRVTTHSGLTYIYKNLVFVVQKCLCLPHLDNHEWPEWKTLSERGAETESLCTRIPHRSERWPSSNKHMQRFRETDRKRKGFSCLLCMKQAEWKLGAVTVKGALWLLGKLVFFSCHIFIVKLEQAVREDPSAQGWETGWRVTGSVHTKVTKSICQHEWSKLADTLNLVPES